MYRILVADDDPAMRGMLAAALTRAGFIIDVVDSGNALLAQLRSYTSTSAAPNLVISDIQMPGMTGLDVLSHIRREMPDLPVLLITAFGDPVTHRRARALGAVELIDKPFDLAMLVRRANEILKEISYI